VGKKKRLVIDRHVREQSAATRRGRMEKRLQGRAVERDVDNAEMISNQITIMGCGDRRGEIFARLLLLLLLVVVGKGASRVG
jgi:hypothetical protein